MVVNEEMYRANRSQLDRLARRSARTTPAGTYLNFAEQPTDPARFYTPSAYRRLREVKAAFDPANVFRANHPIPPL